MKNNVGITGYGWYIPRNRITVAEIAKAHNKNAADITGSLRITEKAVAGHDEDALTMAFEAAAQMLHDSSIDSAIIDAVMVGSETHPYAVKPTATMLAEWLDIGEHAYQAYDTQFACKAATGALRTAFSAVKAGDARSALVCGTDKANAKIGDALEFTAGSGAVSLLVGRTNPMLTLLAATSYSSDTPDFWRRPRMAHPSHGGRFTGKPAYQAHIAGAVEGLLQQTKLKPSQIDYAIFHMPNGRFPTEIARRLGFTRTQIEQSLVVSALGNSYAASALMGFVATLDQVKPGQKVLLASYGSGAGSDAFLFEVTEAIVPAQQLRQFAKQHSNSRYLSYPEYLQVMQLI
jgi:hydroxymethylglutaryl-CoA synthase